MNLNWGIIGLGKIAHHFANDLKLAKNNTLYAVGSRSLDKAINFSQLHGAELAFGSYEDLCKNPKVDIIYIATPHDSHAAYSKLAMQNGKHVLCEKPAGINAQEVEEMTRFAAENKVFFMEALWTRFNPTILAVIDECKKETFGEIKQIYADFSFYKAYDQESRLFNVDRAGGALLDIGIYPIFLSYLLLGKPQSLDSRSILHPTGIDLQSRISMEYKGASAQLFCSLVTPPKVDAFIIGTRGKIEIHSRWHESDGYTITIDEISSRVELPRTGKGYYYEILECHRCITNNELQSKHWSHEDSINLISILDTVRDQNGIIYPSEKAD
ncbi:Gfo/Idh/MocA family oxidoreductase [Saprospiraceae bacterium]|nr:Gfo/Idh/MocA family oxidoreductase [Saprospiraceae bacterium]